ncbi:hypothetical protein [Pseudomonas fluorescens]|uniref:Uncharacterized protein n=1 Tax=Pseudomonas fluorescens TaxID=294 RepID=A0A5E6SN11_PSEFL|nr:hypothetical protein [Pseudomonas fluorescens]VVM77438.1 hypothetical protein PS655_02135 [Pseudomonas fluorescens]
MDTDDIKTEDNADGIPEKLHVVENGELIVCSADRIPVEDIDENDGNPFSTVILHVSYPDLIMPWEAKLSVDYSWNPSGTMFTCQAKRYAATDNGRNKGNVYLSFSSAGNWPERELTNDNAIQDGYWHNITGGGSVTGNKRSADVQFKFTYDHEFNSDKSKSISVNFRFEVDFGPPVITNPQVVHSPLPQISGTGYSGALVKLYEYDQRELVVGTATVDTNGRWTAPLTKPLSMTESFSMTALQLYEDVPSRWAVYTNFAVLFAPKIICVSVDSARRPSVHGEGGLKDAKLEIWLEDKSKGIQLTTTVRQDGTWAAMSGEAWAPGQHLITAKQVGTVSGKSSAWSDTKVVSVKPPAPQIEFPPDDSSVKQELKITGVWPESATLQIFTETDEPVAGSFNGSTRTFTPAGEWAVGLTNIKAVQTVGGVASDPSRSVFVKVRPSSPIIEPPPVPVAARQTLSIKSVSLGATLLEMFNEVDARVAGKFTDSGTTRTFTPAQDWSVSTQVKVVQTVNGMSSKASELVPIVVTLFIASPPYPAAEKEVLAISFASSANNDLRMFTQAGGPIAGSFTDSVPVRYFTPTAAWKAGKTTVKVVQTVGNVANTSNLVTVAVRPFKLSIAAPPSFVGETYELTLVDAPSVNAPGTLQMLTEAGATVTGEFSTGTPRRFKPSPPWPAGKNAVMAVWTVDEVPSDPSSVVTVAVRHPSPIIEPPPVPIAARQTLSIKSVLLDATLLEMFNEVDERVAGEFTDSGTTRTFTPAQDWSVSTLVKVVQTVNGMSSKASELVPIVVTLFMAPPPYPAAEKEVLAISFALSANNNLRMFTQAGGPVAGSITDNGPVRYFTPTAAWKAGKTTVKVVQTVGNVANTSNLVTVAVRPSKLSIAAPPSLVSKTYELTLVGASSVNAPGKLQMLTEAGDTVTGEFSTGTPRKFKPSPPWPAGRNAVMAVRTVDDVPSDPSSVVTFLVKPSQPEIDQPPKPALPRQSLNITSVEPGAVTFEMFTEKGGVIKGDFTGVGASRTFTPTEDWTGTLKIRVVQTVDGSASELSALVTVYAPPKKPEIEQPPIPAASLQNLTITKGGSGADYTLRMFTEAGNIVEGAFKSNGNIATFTPWFPWPSGRIPVKVVHTISGVSSEPSDLVFVATRPYKPLIRQPNNPVTPKQQLTITSIVTGDVTLQMLTEDGETVPGYFDGSGNSRTFTPAIDWSGTTKVKAVQAVDDLFSDPSDPVTVTVKTKPPKPHLTQPLPNSSHLANLAVEGTCEAGATVEVQYASGIALEGEMSYVQTQWSFKHPWEPGQQQIKAVQTSGGLTSDPTDMLDFYIRPPQAVIEQPDTPVAVRGELKISDVWSGVVALRLLTQTDVRVDGEFAGDGATRTFIPDADWTPGENIVYVIQTVNDVDSDPSDPCTFTVEAEDRPDAPRFQQPQLGGRTSRFPTIEVVGLPGALHTVRLEGGATLHEGTANADGSLVFTVVEPLVPGAISLEAKQASNGPDSDWSTPHLFTVKAPPQTPAIEAPLANSETSRYPRFRGTGETGGQIVLHYAHDPQEWFTSVDGSTRWSWTAEQAWSLGDHSIQARQTVDGDCSDWTEARSFKVRESRYAIGDANPAMGTPVVGTEQSVLLRVQVISGVTGAVADGVEVEWRINGEQELLATTQTDVEGWTCYRYTPETAGKHEILADITQENAGVVMTELYEVNAVLHDDWAQAAELYLDGQRVDLAVSDLMLLRKSQPYKLELKVNDGSVLIGSTVTLQNLWGAKERGLSFVPDLGVGQTIQAGVPVHWSVFAEEGTSGIFGLSLSSPLMSDWQLPAYVEAGDLAEAVKVDLDTFPQLFGGDPAFPCIGATHTVTVRPQDHSFLLGHDVVLELSAQAADLGVTVSPTTPQTLGDDGVSWSLNCIDSSQAGNFAVWLKVPTRDFNSLELPMSLGHNKVNISERFGPQEMGGSASYWRYGIRVASTFTGQPAGAVPVTVAVTGKPTVERLTTFDGWIYVSYYSGESARFTIRNRYDGSSV